METQKYIEELEQEKDRLLNQLAEVLEKKGRNPQRVKKDPLDRYYTPAWVTEILVENWPFPEKVDCVWEPCCGEGHITSVLARQSGVEVDLASSDIDVDSAGEVFDFLSDDVFVYKWYAFKYIPYRIKQGRLAIITNPPYSIPGATAADFVRKALEYTPYVAMLLRLPWVEACEDRKSIFAEQPPAEIWAISPRVNYTGPNTGKKQNVNSISCWYIWKPGTEKTVFKWVEGKP